MEGLCNIKRAICNRIGLEGQDTDTTQVTVTIDQFGNLDITDPAAELGAVYSQNVGNLSGTGSKADQFQLDAFGNFKFNPI